MRALSEGSCDQAISLLDETYGKVDAQYLIIDGAFAQTDLPIDSLLYYLYRSDFDIGARKAIAACLERKLILMEKIEPAVLQRFVALSTPEFSTNISTIVGLKYSRNVTSSESLQKALESISSDFKGLEQSPSGSEIKNRVLSSIAASKPRFVLDLFEQNSAAVSDIILTAAIDRLASDTTYVDAAKRLIR